MEGGIIKFGVHTSIAGGIDKAVVRAGKLGCDTVQIFSSNPRGWKTRDLSAEEIHKFNDRLVEYKIDPVIIHAPYLINLASPKEELYQKSISALKEQVQRANRIGAQYFVLHPGSHTGGGLKKGQQRITAALNEVLSTTELKFQLLLENVAGAGTAIGTTIEELAEIYDSLIDKSQIGLCFDTCHAFAGGYDLKSEKKLEELLTLIDNVFGLDNLGVIHANDCKGDLGSNKDRHHHIGEGKIGTLGFERLVNHPQLKDKAFILETPIDEEGNDEKNLAAIRSLVK
ncbi:MAG: deoxyribonuclease IV [Halanaerobacter sp.]